MNDKIIDFRIHNYFNNTYPEGTVEFSRIMNTFLTEKNNGSNDPNYTPKGKPCPK